MAETEISVAIAALVISLVALVVTCNQFLVEIFGSANGYSKCAESVIGPWHTRRRRVWKWSEFRFETQFTTPQVVLLSDADFYSHLFGGEDVHWINPTSQELAACPELSKTIHPREQTNKSPTYRASNTHINLPKGNTGLIARHKLREMQLSHQIKARSEHQVTWLRLLRELHLLQHSYWPDVCVECEHRKRDPLEVCATPLGGSHSPDLSRVAVIYRTWNWDFMPPDLTRPLAEMNIGDTIIMALRMGMQWRVLDLESSRIQADGNGYNITGFEARGLGIILRLTADGRDNYNYPRLIPSSAVNKMLLGVLPGDPDLVGQDFPLIMKDLSLQPLADPSGMLAAIGMPDEKRQEIAEMSQIHVRIDVITFLSAYLPLSGSTMTRYCFPGWNTGPNFSNAYRYWEGRLALHRSLRARLDGGIPNTQLRDTLSTILERMDYLEKYYGDDWYCRWDLSPIIRNGHDVVMKQKCMEDIRMVYAYTQEWWHKSSDTFDRRGAYTQFVAAHAYMATHACKDAKALIKDYQDKFNSQYHREETKTERRARYEIDDTKHGQWFLPEGYEIGLHYVKHLHHENHGIRAYLREINTDWTEDQVEEAWWVMQLRGIAWHFSTWHPDTIVRDVFGEQLIPSSLYGNKSPIWIT
ncbi:hypothetical protein BKA63DRAFT_506751 [Paraphoma chrysanthemicola]|nr:hypothetical protein BKA63DRAFT_506751 [Paraphoma chrysanthemicola]